MHTLIIAEKPSACEKIAYALASSTPGKIRNNKVSSYEFFRGKRKIIAVAAAGHLFSLAEKKKGKPSFELEWKPTYKVNKKAAFTKDYLLTIVKYAKDADKFVSATDYDLEGEVIARNILEFACKAKHFKRMKFSTLTKEELSNSFEHLREPDINLSEAGRARHYLDWIYGINISRALMETLKRSGSFRVLSMGRVQGPTLAILVNREREIRSFVPVPFWQLKALIKGVVFLHINEKFWHKEEAEKALENCEKKGRVTNVSERVSTLSPPAPFDLTALQIEASAHFRFTPAFTLSIAQSLYEKALISYPRTSSQKLPASLNLPKIIKKIAGNPNYSEFAKMLLKNKMTKPHEGKKEDPAHPAIYPTGVASAKLTKEQHSVYDLIVRRFLACFAEPAKKRSMKVTAALGKEQFYATGENILKKGWTEIYPYKSKAENLPNFEKGEEVSAQKIFIEEKQTQPPRRYSQASLVKKMEAIEIGTKATRASIVQTLVRRGYAEGAQSMSVTEFGEQIYELVRKTAGELLDEKLTRKFEEELEKISEGKKKVEDVEEEGRKVVANIVKKFEAASGEALAKALTKMRKNSNELGKCPKCGGTLVIKKSKYGFFVGCSNYPKCKNTYPLPRNAKIIPTGKVCPQCHTPIVKVIRKGKRPFTMCLDPNCPTKKNWGKKTSNSTK